MGFYELTQSIIRDLLDDFLLVGDDDIHRAIGTLVEKLTPWLKEPERQHWREQ
ncbi:MAG: hypothetical protein CM1200mP22_23690 [Dehalococcoidia bacterium]|nr:MAG: hypothetical protein CM1200mP22_23690 [Dehalococcoidia bacterium]